MAYIAPDMALFVASLIVLGIFLRLNTLIEGSVHGFGWTLMGIGMFVVASFFNYLEETPLEYLMLAFTDEEGWDFIVPVFGYAPGGLMFCIGFAQWLRTAVTLRQEIEQREVAEQELQVALIEAGKAQDAKNQFLSIMSHELRTPLTAIIGFSEIMADPKFATLSADNYTEYSDIIRKSAEHLLSIIDDILALSEVESEEHILKEEIFPIEEIIGECFYLLQVEALNHGVTLPERPTGETRIMADRRLVKQIMLNLISNAIRFNRENGAVMITIDSDEVRGLYVTISDTGIGMTAEEAKRALEAFVQMEDATSRLRGGAGLGLTLAKRFTELHGGTLTVTSQKGSGTDITVGLPADRLRKTKERAPEGALKSTIAFNQI